MIPTLEHSRELLRAVVGESFVLLRAHGNLGDELIAAGTRVLFAGLEYDEPPAGTDVRDLEPGRTLVIAGGGGWCAAWRHSAITFLDAENVFERVVVLPSTFDTDDALVRAAIERNGGDGRVTMFARERESYNRLRGYGIPVLLAHCPSFFFDFAPYAQRRGRGVLHAYRGDAESAGGEVPATNVDISVAPTGLVGWLTMIEEHRTIHTDRAHVAIAAALMRKRVRVRPSAYFKVRAMVRTWLRGYDVTMEDE